MRLSLLLLAAVKLVVFRSSVMALAYVSYHKIWPAAPIELYSEPSTALHMAAPLQQDWTFDYSGHYKPIIPILDKTSARFLDAITRLIPHNGEAYPVNPSHSTLWMLQGVHIHISTNVTHLQHGMDESYVLTIPPVMDNELYVTVQAPTVYGALHGLQTLLQLFQFAWLQDGSIPLFCIPDTPLKIVDAPLYAYRGLLFDTSRHYIPLNLILHNLDAMAMNKLNVLHWHLTDSQSWPFQSHTYPELATKGGAYCPTCVYTSHDIQQVIAEASDRGIRVILEVDLPGHCQGK